jgi:large conductance mechanosensitive channel
MRGNVLDLAVGVVIGGAFGKIVSSLVAEVVMPLNSKLTGSVNFANLFINLDPHKTLKDGSAVRTLAEARTAEVPVIAYGQFLINVVDFVIVAFCVFLMVKVINILNRPPAAGAARSGKAAGRSSRSAQSPLLTQFFSGKPGGPRPSDRDAGLGTASTD